MQVLEEACSKKGFQPSSDYELRHGIGRKVVDPTLTMRYAGLANNAKLELVKASQSRATGGTVIVALQTDSGRLQESFSCDTSLWDILLHW
uniref:TUG ubiquitin-like domain-containing protein n=1 Tax=Capitella teleta TaxID=283909 RepID=X2B423_CAPTE